MLGISFECFLESNDALGDMPIERQSKEDLRWHSLVHKSWHILETEFPIVFRVSHKTATSGTEFLEMLQPFLN